MGMGTRICVLACSHLGCKRYGRFRRHREGCWVEHDNVQDRGVEILKQFFDLVVKALKEGYIVDIFD